MVSRYCRYLLPPSVKLVLQKHVFYADGCFYFIYTDGPLLNMSGSKDMAVPNQVTYLTLPKVIHVSAMPNRDFFLERNGSPTKV